MAGGVDGAFGSTGKAVSELSGYFHRGILMLCFFHFT
jgi:hypothetical protein